MKCPVCAESINQIYYKKVNNYSSFLCGNCHHIYVPDNELDSDFSENLYGKDFYENYMDGVGYNKAYETILKEDFIKKIKLIKDLVPVGSRVLEVGSGPGYFSLMLMEEGYDVTAIELTEGAKEYAIKHNKYCEIINEDISLESASIFGNKYDCVISWAVIEHVENVDSFIKLLKGYLDINGYLFIDTGVRTSFLSKIDLGYTSWLYPPYHLHVFSDKSLNQVILNNELKIVLFEVFWNFSRNKIKISYMYMKKIILALLNIKKVITKKDIGRSTFIGLIVAKNN